MKRIILASSSPRRKELLSQIVDNFEIIPATKDEKILKCYPLTYVSCYLAKQKALEVFEKNLDALVIGADTTVICKHQILGKPKDKEDAIRMISLLSNKTHLVVTGVYIISKEFKKKIRCVTKVTFKKLSEKQIQDYCSLNSIYDKAGAYAIQGEAREFIDHIDGDYNNVVGLPIDKIKPYLN